MRIQNKSEFELKPHTEVKDCGCLEKTDEIIRR